MGRRPQWGRVLLSIANSLGILLDLLVDCVQRVLLLIYLIDADLDVY